MTESFSRMHWITDSVDTTVSGNGFLSYVHLVIPAGGRLVRIQVRNTAVEGVLVTQRSDEIGSPSLRLVINLDSLDYGLPPGQDIYTSNRRIPARMAAAIDPTAAHPTWPTYYTYWSAGDEELGVNQSVSWGGDGKYGIGLHLAYRLARPALGHNDGVFKLQLTFAALYDNSGHPPPP